MTAPASPNPRSNPRPHPRKAAKVARLPIGAIATKTNVKVQTIRYYEEIGLMPAPERTQSNRRIYDSHAVQKLQFIRHARELGFSIPAIRALIELQTHPQSPCQNADQIAREQLGSVRAKIERLTALETELARMLERCDGTDIASCRVIEVLGDHSQCHTDHGTPDKHAGKRKN